MLNIAKSSLQQVYNVVKHMLLHAVNFLGTDANLDTAFAAGTPPPSYTWNEAKQKKGDSR